MPEISEATANRIVMFFLFGGVAFSLVRKVQGKADAQVTYKRIWGITLLSIAGAAMAGFFPKIVGPYFALVILAYATGNFKSLSGAAGTLKKQAGAKNA